jgi:hypothetical protein
MKQTIATVIGTMISVTALAAWFYTAPDSIYVLALCVICALAAINALKSVNRANAAAKVTIVQL